MDVATDWSQSVQIVDVFVLAYDLHEEGYNEQQAKKDTRIRK